MVEKNLFILSDINCDHIVNYFEDKDNKFKSHIFKINQEIDFNLIKKENENHLIIIPLIENILTFNDLKKRKFRNLEIFLSNIENYISFKSIILIKPFSLLYKDNSFNFHLDASLKIFYLKFYNLIKKYVYLSNFFLLDYNKLEIDFDNLKFWFHAKIIFNVNSIKKIYEFHQRIVNYINGNSIKLIICDLDNTLWSGVIGDEDFGCVKVGGHDPIGESFYNFQLILKNLKESGVLLAICSKNNENIVKNFFKFRKDMPLKIKDFVSIKANWKPKSENINSILEELNILSNSTLFIDDNLAEIDEVKSKINLINTVLLPENIFEINKIFDHHIFETPKLITKEDSKRIVMLKRQININEQKKLFSSHENWLKSLNTKINILGVNDKIANRAEQLYKRVNQFNTTNRRLNASKILQESLKNSIYMIDVNDKFGSSGIIALINFKLFKDHILVNDLILSCRVAGRKIENIFFWILNNEAEKYKIRKLKILYYKSDKNQPMKDLLFSKIKKFQKNTFMHDFNDQKIDLCQIDYFKSITFN